VNSLAFVVTYVQSCANGRLGLGDCAPVWQLGVIAVLISAMVATLLVMRLRARQEP
jgi:hypothetical protein